ncbi:MAG: hypothetical protein IJ037_13090, partial [Clostridia bacterium]|nr:hypothetical protein [Clostridia bacterium]
MKLTKPYPFTPRRASKPRQPKVFAELFSKSDRLPFNNKLSLNIISITSRKESTRMKNDKKLVQDITSMEVDFAKWYTDICKK